MDLIPFGICLSDSSGHFLNESSGIWMKRAAVHPRVIEKEKCSFRWRRRRRSPDICGQSRPFLVLIEIRQENTARHVHAKWQPSLLPYSNKKSRLDKFEKIDPSHYSIFLSLGKGKMNQYEKELE